MAITLNRLGFRVYATVLNTESESVERMLMRAKDRQHMVVMKMDVTSDEDVDRVYNQVCDDLRKCDRNLWAIVNNAGIMICSRIEWGTLRDHTRVFDVNVFGTMRVTRVFLPLVKESQGIHYTTIYIYIYSYTYTHTHTHTLHLSFQNL